MKKNSRVSVALHSLIHLSSVDRPLTSEELGECQQTNPVIIRRALGELKKAGIVTSEKGHGGGWTIIKKLKDISFQDIFKALDDSLLPAPIVLEEDEHCLIMKSLASTMDEFLEEAEILMAKKLSKLNLKQMMDTINSLKEQENVSQIK
ncbi:MAG: Rrf2 family transcriptional regulator [Bdellovibrionota bacterium]|nr:Rrf2 family transcriptional regulator [Bdellovibrionota bacterium]